MAAPPPLESPYESDAALLPTSLIAADSAHDPVEVVSSHVLDSNLPAVPVTGAVNLGDG